MVSRVERTRFAAWWWTVDRLLLAALLTLMLAGIVLSLAASPPVAARLGLDPFYFVNRHVLYLRPALAVMLTISFLPPRQIRRLALVVFVREPCAGRRDAMFGAEVKGARRWIVSLGVNIQPSEFLKPAFVILIAWLFGKSARRPDMPANTIALALLARRRRRARAAARFRPDHADRAGLGRAVLHGRHADGLGRGAGRRRRGRACGRLYARFRTWRGASSASCDPASGDTFRRRHRRSKSFLRGGWFGRGPGEGTVKRILPDSHTDFVFAVAAEEFGIVLCLLLVALFAFIVIRALHARDARRGPVHALCRGGAGDPVRHCSRRSTWR